MSYSAEFIVTKRKYRYIDKKIPNQRPLKQSGHQQVSKNKSHPI